jgi:hypothetical protein
VFGCPIYFLDAALQDGHKIPKWAPRACLGIFLGFSTLHSSQVPIVMNVDTGKISPQFHIIFDNKFKTVVSMSSEDSLGDQLKASFVWIVNAMKMLITMRMVMQYYLLSPLSLNQIIVTMRYSHFILDGSD